MQTLQQIKGGIENNIGRQVHIKSHRGRIKTVESDGVVESAYQSVFTILVLQDGIAKRQSYAYSDLFTKHLELQWLDE